jgi:GABA permease
MRALRHQKSSGTGGILTAVLSCLNSSFYVASRVLFVLPSRGDAPRALVRTNRRHVPGRAVLLASAFGLAGVIAAILSPAGVFKFLVNASGANIAIIYLMIGVSQVRSRRARERAGLPPSALPMWLFPWLSLSRHRGNGLGDRCDGVHARTAALPSAESSPAQRR